MLEDDGAARELLDGIPSMYYVPLPPFNVSRMLSDHRETDYLLPFLDNSGLTGSLTAEFLPHFGHRSH